MYVACDPVGNVLLIKFSCVGANDVCVFVPASIVFWLNEHLPVNQDPNLPAPPDAPGLAPQDWYDEVTPRAISVECKQFADGLRITFVTPAKPYLTVLLDRSNVELLRRFLLGYSSRLINLDA